VTPPLKASAPPQQRFLPQSLQDWLQLIVTVLVIGGAPWAGFQFWTQQQETRVARTLDLVRRLDEPPLRQAQIDVAEISAVAAHEIRALDDAPGIAAAPAADQKALRERIIIKNAQALAANGASDLKASIVDVAEFFDGVQICIERKACDGPTAHAFLDGYADTFWRNFEPVVHDEARDRRPRFAAGLVRFAQAARSQP
jgi:hypothetical protein